MSTGPRRCTWLKPSRDASLRCGDPAVAWWFQPGVGEIRRCRKHYSPEAADTAEAFGVPVTRPEMAR